MSSLNQDATITICIHMLKIEIKNIDKEIFKNTNQEFQNNMCLLLSNSSKEADAPKLEMSSL